ncbi:MAG TPA: TRAP transporter substrate-binding protein [Burkholderiales bacterium]|nr:TRAP transporter substrate-binding protein [Burkholderiales bacterium]
MIKKQRAVSAAKSETVVSRRKFLKGAAAVGTGAAAIGFPMIAKAQAPITLRFQSTWPTKDIFHEYALDYAKKVNEMTGGRLKIEVLPAGAVVKAFDMIEAVHKGILDGGHGVAAYWYGRHPAYSLFGTSPGFGMDANMLLAWVYYGGGLELYNELQHKIMNFDLVGFLYGPMPTQPFGWFKKEIKSVDDMKTIKFRTVGLAVDNYKEFTASVVALPGGEIVSALDRGLIDAAEFNNASSDRALGFQDVAKHCYLQSYHQPLECFEILFNKKKYDALPTDIKSIIKYAVEAAHADMSWKALDRYSQDYIELQTKDKVNFHITPKDILEAQLKAWDVVIKRKSDENPFFAKVIESQKAWAKRVAGWGLDTIVSPTPAYTHFFGKRALS